jgi:SEC-C motif
MPADPLAQLRKSGEKLRPELRDEILALGAAAVAPLLKVLDDDFGDWASIHAVDLLADLKAPEAIQPLLDALPELTLDDILYSRIAIRLSEFGPAVLEPALAMLAEERALDDAEVEDDPDAEVDEETVSAICEVLAKLGVKDERIFEALCWWFERGETWTAGAFAEYGDKRAVPILEAAIADFEPDFSYMYGGTDLMDLIEPYESLGGVLSPELRSRFDAWFARWGEMKRRAREPRPTFGKMGRNDPCHCGSGKKYKKCCLDADEAARPRRLETNGERLHVSGGVSDDELDLAKQYFRDKDEGRGPAAQMADYAKPIIDATDGSFESMQKALNIAMLFWNLSVLRDAKREEALAEMVARIAEADRAEWEQTARMMIERHRTMFPEMHRGDATSVIARF